MKKTSILKRFYGVDKAKFTMQSVEALDRAIYYHEPIMQKYMGNRFSSSLKRVTDTIKYLSSELIDPGEVIYKDFRDMAQCLITKIFEYLNNHPDEEGIKYAVERYGSKELINLKSQLDTINLKLRKSSNVLSNTLDDQYLCLSQIKTATERAKKIYREE